MLLYVLSRCLLMILSVWIVFVCLLSVSVLDGFKCLYVCVCVVFCIVLFMVFVMCVSMVFVVCEVMCVGWRVEWLVSWCLVNGFLIWILSRVVWAVRWWGCGGDVKNFGEFVNLGVDGVYVCGGGVFEFGWCFGGDVVEFVVEDVGGWLETVIRVVGVE